MPKIIDCEQGSDQWLALRYDKITSTDVSSILGLNPFKSVEHLWKLKQRLIPPDEINEKMKRGSELEEPARQLLIKETGIDFKPAVLLHDNHSWAMASLDGLSDCGRFIAEIKSPNEDTHKLALNGIIKEYYHAQIQHALFVSGAEKCYYFSYRPEFEPSFSIIEVYPNKEFIEKMIPKLYDFWLRLSNFQEPEKPWELKK